MRLITNLLLITLVFTFGCASTGPYPGIPVTEYITRGPMPTDAQIDALKASGYVNYLNLMDVDSIIDYGAVTHLTLKWGYGFVNIPMSNWTRPKKEALIRAAMLLNDWNKRHEKSIVTCRWGHDRTGETVGAYEEMYWGYDFPSAYAEMLYYGHNKFLYDGWPFHWERSLQEVEGYVKGGESAIRSDIPN